MEDEDEDCLRVYLLGPPRLIWSGSEWVLPRRQVRALFYRLAVESGALSRSYLAGLFWCEMPESGARRNLSRLLTYLDRALPVKGILISEPDHVFLAPETLWVDTRVAAQSWLAWLKAGSIRELRVVVNLYTDGFLAGFELPGNREYSAWIQLESAYWREQYATVLEKLVELEAESGDLPAAIRYARLYLNHNELSEAMHRRLMRLYAARGDYLAGVQQYEQCFKVLERELGVRPDRSTQEVYREMLSGAEHPQPVEVDPILWMALPSLPAPFVGRQAALDKLEKGLAAARAGRGGLTLVTGEPGIGKSRLIQEFAGLPRMRVRVLFGAAAPSTQGSFYQPLVEALRGSLRYPGLLSQVSRPWLSEAARLLPELAELTPLYEQPLQLDPEAAQARLFEALYRLILGLTVGGYTLLLCLEDLHYADVSTLDWLAYAGRRLAGAPVFVIGSFRSQKTVALSGRLSALSRLANFAWLPLEGLDRQAVARLCAYLSEESLQPEVTDHLHQVSGGNPFFLLEIVRAAAEAGQGPDAILETGKIPISGAVKALVDARIEHLSSLARQVLEAGSVLGTKFSLAALHMTAGRAEMETLDGLDELVARQFLQEVETGYQFCHEISREAVYAGLSYWRKRRLHTRAAESMEQLAPADWPALAWHFKKAGDLQRAAEYNLRAGQAAKTVFAQVEGRSYFQRALELLAEDAQMDAGPEAVERNRRLRIQALYERGWALRLLGEMDAYTRDLEEVAEIAQALGDTQELAHLYWQQAYNHRWFCRYSEARQAAGRGLALAESLKSVYLEAVCRRELGLAARETGDDTGAESYLEAAYALFRQLNHALYCIHTCGNLATLYSRTGRTDLAFSWAQKALEICNQGRLDFERRLPLGDLGVAEAGRENFTEACALLQESLAIARQISDRTQEIFCQGHLGWIALETGEIEAAQEYLQSALDLAVQVRSLSEQSWLQAGLAEAAFRRGELERAAEHARSALDLAHELGRRPDERRAQEILSRLG